MKKFWNDFAKRGGKTFKVLSHEARFEDDRDRSSEWRARIEKVLKLGANWWTYRGGPLEIPQSKNFCCANNRHFPGGRGYIY